MMILTWIETYVDIDEVEMEAEKENIGDRISFDAASDELMEGECPVNTAKNNEWAYENFESWCTARNQRFPKMCCSDNVFSSKEVRYSSSLTLHTRACGYGITR